MLKTPLEFAQIQVMFPASIMAKTAQLQSQTEGAEELQNTWFWNLLVQINTE